MGVAPPTEASRQTDKCNPAAVKFAVLIAAPGFPAGKIDATPHRFAILKTPTMTTPTVKPCLSPGDDSHPKDTATVVATVSRDAFYSGLTYEQVAQVFESAASQMRAFADAHPGEKTKTLEHVCASITGSK